MYHILNVTELYYCIRYHRSFGFRRKRRLRPRSFGKHSLPMILHWNKGVFTLTNMRILFLFLLLFLLLCCCHLYLPDVLPQENAGTHLLGNTCHCL